MTRSTAASLAVPAALLSMCMSVGCSDSRAPEADLILVNAKVVTLDSSNSIAGAIAIRGDRIQRVGSNREVLAHARDRTRILDLRGKTVVPGFNDAHLHFESGGFSLTEVDLRGVARMEEIERRIRSEARALPEGSWIRGRGWDHTLFPGGRWPTREPLDNWAPRNPVYLRRVCGHAAWVNSAALEAAGIARNTPDPEGGEIARDAGGVPTGILKENACDLVKDVIPERSPEERRRAARAALSEAARLGVTSVQDMGTSLETMAVWEDLRNRGELTVRIGASPLVEEGRDSLPSGWDRSRFQDTWLRVGPVKMYSDGALGAATAALLKPYQDHPTSRGMLVTPAETLGKLVGEAHRSSLQVAIHAIGDRGNRVVLDAIEKATLSSPRPDSRHRVEHAQVLAPEDIPRFVELGIIASMQPTHCTSDMRWAEDRLGPVRVRGAYAWRSLLDCGTDLAFGTDWPIEHLDPLLGLYAAVTRQDAEGHPPGGWYPDQCITLEEALRAYTLGSAYASFEEDIKGSIEEGKLADLVVLSRPVMEIPTGELLETEVVMTIVGGRIVFQKES